MRLAPRTLLAVCAVLACACQSALRPAALPALRTESEVYVYLRPAAEGAGRVELTLAGVVARGADGTEVALERPTEAPIGLAKEEQRLVAFGRLSAGEYAGVAVTLSRATLADGGSRHDLSVPEAPVLVAIPFTARARTPLLLSLTVDVPRSVSAGMSLVPAVSGEVLGPVTASTAPAAYVSNEGAASLAAFDRRSGEVLAILPTGGEPRGVIVESSGGRAFVALGGEDRLQVLDVQSGAERDRIELRPGDRPRDLALTFDGRTLLVTNEGSSSVSFVDPAALVESGRVVVGEQPWSMVLDRTGRRAYVLAGRSSALVVLDVPSRSIVATIPTNVEPLQVELNRAGDRLYLVDRSTPYLSIYSTASLSLVNRVFVGPAGALRVDPITDYLYVADRDSRAVRVYDPFSFTALASIDVPAPVSFMTFDRLHKTLLAVMPSANAIATIDLVTRAVRRRTDVGLSPFIVGLPGDAP